MNRPIKIALVGATLAVLAAGCASGYYDDDSYYQRSYYGSSYGHGYYQDRDGYTNGDRVRVCDDDGDDCHWEYRH